ncbi:unnamed protein product [Rotaria socialis]|uniref:Reverse transcriptase domain-containing protein n=1 Tax=Rotaria socialis TaxID=392032 RepID=A0A821U4Q8_9BILA|nr:unnamed protein product [Rotaria socialis]CAF4882186.1 unnamed protein product [Rotaria socialis]
MALQETFLSPGKIVKLNNYQQLRKDRNGGGGGVSLIIHNSLSFIPVNVQSVFEVVAAKVYINKTFYTICSIYIPPQVNFGEQQLKEVWDQLPKPCLILGDFNSHHPMWGSEHSDCRGKAVVEFMMANGVHLNNDPELLPPTYFSTTTKQFSHLDLSLSSGDMEKYVCWEICEDLWDSDHFPIFIELCYDREVERNNNKVCGRIRFNLDKGNWKKYSDKVNLSSDWDNKEINECSDTLYREILESAIEYIPIKSHVINFKYCNNWWNEECDRAVRKRKSSLRKYHKFPSDFNFVLYKKDRAYARYVIKQAKQDSWRNFVQSISYKNGSQQLWGRIKALKTGKGVQKAITLRDQRDGVYVADPVKTSKIFAEHFALVSSIKNYQEPFVYHMTEGEFETISFDSENEESYNVPFNISELKYALACANDTTPGNDDIHYRFLKALNDKDMLTLLGFYNQVWVKEKIPEKWKESILLPILKCGKASFLPESYRPIALNSCVGKIMERLVMQRLSAYMEENRMISPSQCGFRKGYGTLDALVRLESSVREGFLRGEFVVAVFLDIEKAYDSVWQHGLLIKLRELGLRGHLPKFIQNFITNRNIKVKVDSTYSESYHLETGLQQGSVLSPILFLIYINMIFSGCPEDVMSSIFADDCAVWIASDDLEKALDRMRTVMQALEEWSDMWGLKFSPNKTKYLIFSKRPIPAHDPLTFRDAQIELVAEYKF